MQGAVYAYTGEVCVVLSDQAERYLPMMMVMMIRSYRHLMTSLVAAAVAMVTGDSNAAAQPVRAIFHALFSVYCGANLPLKCCTPYMYCRVRAVQTSGSSCSIVELVLFEEMEKC